MAESKKPKRRLKKPETVRERANKPAMPKKRKLQPIKDKVSRIRKPIGKAAQIGKKEYYLPLPDNKLGRFLNKKRSFIPKYFKESWQELKQVEWPGRKETWQLTLAVFAFAIFFGLLIAVVDYGLDKLFKALILE